MKKNKGFTLIELLVVIAIIGILASVVLASLNSARAKGADAAIKANLANIRSQAEMVYDDANGSYAAVCTNPNILKARAAADSVSGGETVCNDEVGEWAIASPLKTSSSNYWCVDSTGTSAQKTTPLGVLNACPAV